MTSLRERLKAKKLREQIVEVDGDSYLIIELGRTANNELLQRSQTDGVVDGNRYEAENLAACVHDPDTREQVEPDWKEWASVPTHISDQLFAACMAVKGSEVKRTTVVKNSGATEN